MLKKWLFKFRKPKGGIFDNQRINLDYAKYDGAIFNQCVIVYAGSEFIELSRCNMNGCRFEFEGQAAATVNLMINLMPKEVIAATFGLDPYLLSANSIEMPRH